MENLKRKYLKILMTLLTWAFAAAVLCLVVPRTISFFAPFVVGFIISLIGLPMVRFLENKIKIKRKYGTFIIIVAVIALIILVFYGLATILTAGIKGFVAYLPTLYENGKNEIYQAAAQLEELLHKIPAFKNTDVDSLLSSLGESLSGSLSKINITATIGDFVAALPDILVGVVVGLLATYYFIADHDKMEAALRQKLSPSIQMHCRRIYDHILKTVGGYFKAQLKIMVIIYIVLLVGLLFLKVKYAWLIGFGIAFLDMLPVFGTGTVLWPWAIVKLFSGNTQTAVGMIILYFVTLVLHQLIQPKMVGDQVGMETFPTIVFMFIGYKISGILGMIVAIPVGMILMFYYRDGGFDSLIWCFKEIVSDINKVRKS